MTRHERMYLRLGKLAEARYHYCKEHPNDFNAVGKLVRLNRKLTTHPLHNTYRAQMYVASEGGRTTLEYLLRHG